MSNILGNMPPVFGSGYRGVVPAPSAADVSAQNILRADGTWGAGPSGTLPSQTGNGGKLLTTDGTNASWAPSLNSFSISDLTFGVGGPNAKASVVSRSASQGLVFDGTNSGSATMGSSLGTSSGTVDMVLDVPSSNPSTSRGIFTVGPNSASANYANAFHGELRTDGKIWINLSGSTTGDYRRAESSSSLVSLFGGKRIRLTVVRDSSASTLTVYANGVALAMTETTGGTPPAWSGSITGTYFVPGRISATENHIGYYALSGIYNRALSASEVVALYEAGAPSGADYNSASNTTFVTGFTQSGQITSFTANATSWSGTGTAYAEIYPTGAITSLTVGKRYRLVIGTVTGTIFASGGVSGSALTSNTTYDFTATATSVVFFTSTVGSIGITGISLTKLGLLLAPDAAQAGGGLVWYDTSGNAANITLPASGVSWNVPSSGYVTAPTTTNLTLAGGSSGASLVLGQGTNGAPTLAAAGSGTPTITKLGAANGARRVALSLQTGADGTLGPVNIELAAYPSATGSDRYGSLSVGDTGAWRPLVLQHAGGNVLVGTTTDGGQKLQVSGNAYVSGGLSSGGNGTIGGTLSVNGTDVRITAATGYFYAGSPSTLNGFVVSSASNRVDLYTNNIVALTLDSSQRAQFASIVGIGASPTTGIYATLQGDPGTLTYTNADSWIGYRSAVERAGTTGVGYGMVSQLRVASGTQTYGVGISAETPGGSGTVTNFQHIRIGGRDLITGNYAIYDNSGYDTRLGGTLITQAGTASTPASASATGTAGMIKWDASYIYVCTATNTWKRVAIATWP